MCVERERLRDREIEGKRERERERDSVVKGDWFMKWDYGAL